MATDCALGVAVPLVLAAVLEDFFLSLPISINFRKDSGADRDRKVILRSHVEKTVRVTYFSLIYLVSSMIHTYY